MTQRARTSAERALGFDLQSVEQLRLAYRPNLRVTCICSPCREPTTECSGRQVACFASWILSLLDLVKSKKYFYSEYKTRKYTCHVYLRV
jgi:hypothetical protein